MRRFELTGRELIAELHLKYSEILVGFQINIQGSKRQSVSTLARVMTG